MSKVLNLHNSNIYIILVSIGIIVYIIKEIYKSKYIKKKEHFYGPFGKIFEVLKSLAYFLGGFPDMFLVMVDALINFFLQFVDIILLLVDSLEWIINVPMWFVDALMFITIGFADIIILVLTWLNPVTMIKGIIKMIFFVIKVIFAFIFDILRHIFEIFSEKFLNFIRSGLWGIPHVHVKHKVSPSGRAKDIKKKDLGMYGHHHDGHDEAGAFGARNGTSEKDAPMEYKPMRCYKGIGTTGYINIISTIICPPLGIFMSYGISGWFKILICCALTLLYYVPGLIYALLVTTHLGIGKDFITHDCDGDFGGFIVYGCERRLTKSDCLDAKIPDKRDSKGEPVRACKWLEGDYKNNVNYNYDWESDTEGDVYHTTAKEQELHGGRCASLHFRKGFYNDLMSGTFSNESIDRDDNIDLYEPKSKDELRKEVFTE